MQRLQMNLFESVRTELRNLHRQWMPDASAVTFAAFAVFLVWTILSTTVAEMSLLWSMLAALGGTFTLVLLAVLIALFQRVVGLAGHRATTIAWTASVLFAMVAWWVFIKPTWIAFALGATSLGTFLALRAMRRRHRRKSTMSGLFDDDILKKLEVLPKDLPTRVRPIIDRALKDYLYVRDLMDRAPSSDDTVSIKSDSRKTLIRLLDLTQLATKTDLIAQARSDNSELRQIATHALRDLQVLSDNLHDAVAIIPDATTDNLRAHTERLRELAERRQEHGT